MKRSLLTRILVLALIYFAVFFTLAFVQFSGNGNFTYSAGTMTIRGRYLQSSTSTSASLHEMQAITGGVRIFYNGLELNLREENPIGLSLTGIDSGVLPVHPDFMLLDDSIARFILPGGTVLVFSSLETTRGPELRISAEFTDDVSEVIIPIVPRRSTLIRENDQYGILFNGDQYFFGRSSWELENSLIVLSRENASISYRARGRQRVFHPADFIIAQAKDYENVLADWKDASFIHWNQNASSLQNEDDIIAFCSEAILRGSYTQAVSSISRNFIDGPLYGFRSSAFTGNMSSASRSFVMEEQNKLNHITRLINERSVNIFLENNVLDFLFTRSHTDLASAVLDILRNLEIDDIKIEHCPGILEAYLDFEKWLPAEMNFIVNFMEQILLLISENIYYDTENDSVYVLHNGNSEPDKNAQYSIRLGVSLLKWAEASENPEWADISRSLILSSLANGGTGSGELYNFLDHGEYYPRAEWLTNDGLWAWTASPSARAAYINEDLNLTVTFPVNMVHYMIISGVQPFRSLQIHGQTWRTDPQFERYDSSGWVYFPQDQILVLKLRHRAASETVRIVYRAPPPPPPPRPAPVQEETPFVPIGEIW